MSESEGQSDAEREIIRLDEELTRAAMRADLAALNQNFADDVLVTTPSGVIGKSAVMAEFHQIARKVAAGEAKLESYSQEEMEARVYGETAVTSYRLATAGRYEGQEVSQRFQIMDVWMKRGGRWQVVARHTAIIEGSGMGQATG
jgi:ketosteroid isomerase-like protein